MGFETLVVDGVDLSTLGCLTDLGGLYESTTGRGDNIVFPGINGETWVPKPYATNTIDIGLTLSGTSTTNFNDQYKALKTVLRPGKKFMLERHLSYSTGNSIQIADGELAAPISPALTVMRFGKLALSFKVLTGVWYSTGFDQFVINSSNLSHFVQGDAHSRKMQIDMFPGILTNVTTGNSLTWAAAAGYQQQTTIDNENMTARVYNPTTADDSKDLSWTKSYPMELAPGLNTFTLTSHPSPAAPLTQVVITMTPAYT